MVKKIRPEREGMKMQTLTITPVIIAVAGFFYLSLKRQKDELAKAKRMICPHCAESIRETSKICKYCGKSISKVRVELSQPIAQ